MDMSDVPENSEANLQGVPCTICGKYLSSYSSLCDHKRIHTGDRPHICQICNKRFTQKAHLMIHRRTHTGEKPYNCTICHKRFAQSSHLKNHKRIHTGEKAYICSICNHGFNQKPRLEKHLAQHFAKSGGGLDQDSHNDYYGKYEFSIEPHSARSDSLSGDVSTFIKQEVHSPKDGLGTSDEVNEEITRDDINADKIEALQTRHVNKRKSAVVNRIHPTNDSDIDEDDLDYSLNYSRFLKPEDGCESTENLRMKTSVIDHQLDTNDEVMDEMLHPSNGDDVVDLPNDSQVTSTENRAANSGSDDVDRASNASESNYSSDAGGTPTVIGTQLTTMLHGRNLRASSLRTRLNQSLELNQPTIPTGKLNVASYMRTNNRVCLVDFTTDDLLIHMMSRDDVHKCDFCCMIFQDQAMYHLHRSMHDKFDIRACNLCGKVSRDKHDFLAHFLSEHK